MSGTVRGGVRQLQPGMHGPARRMAPDRGTFTPGAAPTANPPPVPETAGRFDPGQLPVAFNVVLAFVVVLDVAVLAGAGLATSFAAGQLFEDHGTGPELLASLVGGAATLCWLRLAAAWTPSRLRRLGRRFAVAMAAIGAGGLASLGCLALIPSEQALLPVWPLLWVANAALLAAAVHLALSAQVARWLAQGRLLRRVAVVGAERQVGAVLDRMERHGSGYEVEVAGTFADLATHPAPETLDALIAQARVQRIDAVLLAIPLTEPDRIAAARAVLRPMVAEIHLVAGLAGHMFRSAEVIGVGSVPVVTVGSAPLSPWQVFQKSVLDRSLALMGMICLLPLLGLVAAAIKLDSRGPVLFRQPRLGFNNTIFTVYKFRTMFHANADLMADAQTRRGDVRITKVGRWLRRFSLDELPQLLNVLEGSMSLVGPRPHAPNTKAGATLFHNAVAEYALRHRVLPGITGWAQVNGWRGETQTLRQIEQRVSHDLYYIDNWSLLFDLRILLLTVRREIVSSMAF